MKTLTHSAVIVSNQHYGLFYLQLYVAADLKESLHLFLPEFQLGVFQFKVLSCYRAASFSHQEKMGCL